MLRAVALALLVAGCTGGKAEFDLTLVSDSSLSDAALLSARHLHVSANGPDAYNGDVALAEGRGLLRTERLVYKPHATNGTVSLGFTLYDGNDNAIGFSSGPDLDLASPHPAIFTLSTTGTPGDGGADLAVPDGGLCPTGAIICDDFEGGTLANWTADPGVTVDGVHAHRGSFAAHVRATRPDGGPYQQTFFGLNYSTSYPLYIRAWVFLPAATEARSGAINLVVTSLQSGDVILGYGGGTWALGSQNLGAGEAAPQLTSSMHVATDVWTCYEWRIDAVPPGGTGGVERVAFDGVDDPTLHANGVQLSPVNEILFGWTGQLTTATPIDLWFDDIVVAHAPIGCQ